MSDKIPDRVKAFGGVAINNSGVWFPEIVEDSTRWGWQDDEQYAEDVAKLVMEEVNKLTMADLDIGDDGIAIVTFGLFEFDHALCVDLSLLVDSFIGERQEGDDMIRGDDGAKALRLPKCWSRQPGICAPSSPPSHA
jgi:hypothetical protein